MRLRDMQSGALPPSDCREQVQRTASASLWTALSNRMPRHLRLLNPMGAWGVSDEAGVERERGKEREDYSVSVCVGGDLCRAMVLAGCHPPHPSLPTLCWAGLLLPTCSVSCWG